MLSENYEDLLKLRNSQFEQEDPYEHYALQYIRDTNTPGRFTAREVLCHEMFYKDPEKIKRTALTAMGKSLARIGCIRTGQSNKKGDRSRYWIKSEKWLSKSDSVSSFKKQLEQSPRDF